MQVSQTRGLALFDDCRSWTPRNTSPKALVALHDEIFHTVQDRFFSIGGPELPEVRARVLPQAAFLNDFILHDFDASFPGDASKVRSHCGWEITRGKAIGSITYNLDALLAHTSKEQGIAAHMIFNALCGIYYPRAAFTPPAGHPLISSFGFSVLTVAWESYLSQSHFTPGELLTYESLAANPGSSADYFSRLFASPNFFGALALYKIELAFGFQAMVDLMHTPHYCKGQERWIEGDPHVYSLWSKYVEACRKLRSPCLSYQQISANLLPEYGAPSHTLRALAQ